MDLADLFKDENALSPRLALAHISCLPNESNTVAELRGGEQFRGWDESRYIQVASFNAIRMLTHFFVLSNMDPKKSKPKPPIPYPLPEDKVDNKASRDKPGSFAAISKAAIAKAKKRKGVG